MLGQKDLWERDRRDESCHIADGSHQVKDHPPSKVRTVDRTRLSDDRTDTFGLDDTPDEEDNSGSRCQNSLDSEKMATRELELE